jgi:hypothetical protein
MALSKNLTDRQETNPDGYQAAEASLWPIPSSCPKRCRLQQGSLQSQLGFAPLCREQRDQHKIELFPGCGGLPWPRSQTRTGQHNEGASIPEGAAGLQGSFWGPSGRRSPLFGFQIAAQAQERARAGTAAGVAGAEARAAPCACAGVAAGVAQTLLFAPSPRAPGPALPPGLAPRQQAVSPRSPPDSAAPATYALIQLYLHLLLGDALLDPLAEAGVAGRPPAPLTVLPQAAQLPGARPRRSRGPRRRDRPAARHLSPGARPVPVPR